ncbi:unnamed protein product [Alternaria alternata]
MVQPLEPYSLHIPLLEAVVAMQDLSVWSDRSLPTRGSQGFLMMHEAARHAIHSFETLSVTMDTVEAMQRHVVYLTSKSKQKSANEPDAVSKAYNMIAQRDSQVMTGLGEAARRDSSAMRTIAVVTMAFLPPTFLSAIFSMSFFNYTPDQGSVGWSVSGKFWVYWVCAVPLTCITLMIWYWRQRRVES